MHVLQIGRLRSIQRLFVAHHLGDPIASISNAFLVQPTLFMSLSRRINLNFDFGKRFLFAFLLFDFASSPFFNHIRLVARQLDRSFILFTTLASLAVTWMLVSSHRRLLCVDLDSKLCLSTVSRFLWKRIISSHPAQNHLHPFPLILITFCACFGA
jgi:hypothetical protein